MKYHPKTYARAFVDLAPQYLKEGRGEALVKSFLELMRRYGDEGQSKKVFSATEKAFRERFGVNKIIFESARKPGEGLRASFAGLLRERDEVEQRINPELVAGIKILINDERQLDWSFRRKVEKLFRA